jgi:hypothetical protein
MKKLIRRIISQIYSKMEKSLWDRLHDLRESVINSDVEPQPFIRLPTKTVKAALAVFLGQNALISFWWSVKDGVFYPWLLFTIAFLQVGLFWNRVTDSWRRGQYDRLFDEDDTGEDVEVAASTESESPPPPKPADPFGDILQ